MRVRKNYYSFSFGQYCGLLVNEKTMKKISKLQYEVNEKVLEILENSEDIYSYSWSISEEPKEISQNERIYYYIDDDSDSEVKHRLENLTKKIFDIRKIKNLYKVNGKYNDSRELAGREHTEFLLKCSKKEMEENKNE